MDYESEDLQRLFPIAALGLLCIGGVFLIFGWRSAIAHRRRETSEILTFVSSLLGIILLCFSRILLIPFMTIFILAFQYSQEIGKLYIYIYILYLCIYIYIYV